jgi:hypothetical protein
LESAASKNEAEITKRKYKDNAWVRLGCKTRYRIGRLRLVRVQTAKDVLLLLANLGPEELSAAQVAARSPRSQKITPSRAQRNLHKSWLSP